MPTLPPRRVPVPAAAPQAEAAATATEAAPAPAAPPRAAPPVKQPKASAPPAVSAPPAKKAVIKATKKAPMKAAPLKAAPKAVAKPPTKVVKKSPPKASKTSPRPATDNVVPKVLKIKTRIWGDEAVELGTIIVDMKKVVPAITDNRIEIRAVSPRLQVMFSEKLGINCLKVYSNLHDVAKIVKFLQRVPEELLPSKWPNAFVRIEKRIAKELKD